jgi:hypothetical protein
MTAEVRNYMKETTIYKIPKCIGRFCGRVDR